MSKHWPWIPLEDYDGIHMPVDVLAKRWNPETDKFEYKRFTDCVYELVKKIFLVGTPIDHSAHSLQKLGWYPIAYMNVPPLTEDSENDYVFTPEQYKQHLK